MNRRFDPPNEVRPDALREDEHLTDELLLLAVDGELPGRVSLQVKEHLEACWSCRSRSDAIEKCINDVVGYKSLFLLSCTPPSDEGRAGFLKQLAQRSQRAGRPPLWRRLSGYFHLPSFLRERRRFMLVYGLPVACLVAILLLQFRRIPVVNAEELLSNAQDGETRALTGAARPVVYQKLRIRGEGRDVIQFSYRDVGGHRHADHFERDPHASGASTTPEQGNAGAAANPEASDNEFLESWFTRAQLDWEDPLSVAHFRAWHDAYSIHDDVFHRDGDSLTLRTRADVGPIAEAQFTVRRSDFHPISEHIELRDAARLDIEEMGYQVMGLDAINDALFAPAPAAISAPLKHAAPSVAAPREIPANLADVEMQARTVLHANGADIAEQIQITTSDRVTVRGVVATDERKLQLQSALAKIPHVEAILQSPEAADATADATNLETLQQEQTPAALPSPLEGLLETRFPDQLERESFVHQVLSLAQDSSDRAWALRRVAERYSPGEIAALKPESRRALETIARDHMAGLRYSSNMLRTILEGFLGGTSLERAGVIAGIPLTTSNEPNSSARTAQSWQEDAQQLFSLVDRETQITFQLMSGSEAGNANAMGQDPDTLTKAWLDVSAELQLQTMVVSARLDGDFLNPSGGIQ